MTRQFGTFSWDWRICLTLKSVYTSFLLYICILICFKSLMKVPGNDKLRNLMNCKVFVKLLTEFGRDSFSTKSSLTAVCVILETVNSSEFDFFLRSLPAKIFSSFWLLSSESSRLNRSNLNMLGFYSPPLFSSLLLARKSLFRHISSVKSSSKVTWFELHAHQCPTFWSLFKVTKVSKHFQFFSLLYVLFYTEESEIKE